MSGAAARGRGRGTLRHLAAAALALLGSSSAVAAPLGAQSANSGRADRVGQLAALLAAEDARAYDAALLSRGVQSPAPLVRRHAALAIGRIGDRRGTHLLVPLLTDPDTAVGADAAFALGLLRDTAAVPALARRLFRAPFRDAAESAEAATAIARIGGGDAAAAVARLLSRTRPVPRAAIAAALLEAWRLEEAAPIPQLLRYSRSPSDALRWRAVYSLARLRAPAAALDLAAALDDRLARVRALAARALVRRFVTESGLDAADVSAKLARLTADDDPGVRIHAMLALATYADSGFGPVVAPGLDDSFPNARVAAATALGRLGGTVAVHALAAAAHDSVQPWAVRREALLALAHSDTAAFAVAARDWTASGDWRDRAAAAEGWVESGGTARAGTGEPAWLRDPDSRVVAWGLQAWTGAVEGPDPVLVAVARPRLAAPDAAVRSLAADVLARAADPRDVPALIAAYHAAKRDSFPEAALSALSALAAIAKTSDSAAAALREGFVADVPGPENYLLRAWAERNWPALAERWGPAHPIATGRDASAYQSIVRRFIVGAASKRLLRVAFETEERGTFTVELLGADAPLTAAHFLELVDAGFFDGNRWHRVVPDFVIQDGDPRGDGWGGPPGAIRDEINRVRYDGPVLGMALSGPDTGNSQWFVNLSPQPHLDGSYTVFGRVVDATASALYDLTQGDRIIAVRRLP
ncbi:MAG TPA: peptidylprolyl isomerase [Gemmatimonadales bacterium]|nr:peptidylprolyl isomerase [Gemmatimonadales bacterium]